MTGWNDRFEASSGESDDPQDPPAKRLVPVSVDCEDLLEVAVGRLRRSRKPVKYELTQLGFQPKKVDGWVVRRPMPSVQPPRPGGATSGVRPAPVPLEYGVVLTTDAELFCFSGTITKGKRRTSTIQGVVAGGGMDVLRGQLSAEFDCEALFKMLKAFEARPVVGRRTR